MERREREPERIERMDRRFNWVMGLAGLAVALLALFEPPFTWAQLGRLILPDAVRSAITGAEAPCPERIAWLGGASVETSRCSNP